MSDQDRDLIFVAFCAFIFEKRTQQAQNSTSDKNLSEISKLLQEYGKLNLDCGDKAPTLDFDDPDSSKLVALLNTYSPDFSINLKFSKDTFPANTLNIRSPSTFRYELQELQENSEPFHLPLLHGGKIEVVGGDLSFDSVVDALISTPAHIVFTTDINISGALVGCTHESLQNAVDVLRRGLSEEPEENIFRFSLSASIDEEQVLPSIDPVVVRTWIISLSTSDSRCCLQAQRSPL